MRSGSCTVDCALLTSQVLSKQPVKQLPIQSRPPFLAEQYILQCSAEQCRAQQCRGQKCEGGLGEHLVALFHPYKLAIPKDFFCPAYVSHHSVLASVWEHLVKSLWICSLGDVLYGRHWYKYRNSEVIRTDSGCI